MFEDNGVKKDQFIRTLQSTLNFRDILITQDVQGSSHTNSEMMNQKIPDSPKDRFSIKQLKRVETQSFLVYY